MNSFEELGVHPCFTEKLKERSIVKPTAIQSLVITRLLEGGNILFRSATGTGKTFAYLLPALHDLVCAEENVNYSGGPAVLICAPTFELCSQIKEEVDFLTASKDRRGLKSALLIGSVKIDKQIESLKKIKPAVAAGSLSRLLVLAKMKRLDFSNLRFLILDEADRLTAQECIEETEELLAIIKRNTDKRKNNILRLAACSATVGIKTREQLGVLFKDAEILKSDDHEIIRERIEHWAVFSEKRRKVQTLRSLLAALKNGKSRIKALVFTSRNDEAGKILSQLQYHHIKAEGLFGKMIKKPITGVQRREALDSFKNGGIEVLVCTDLAARGLHIPGVTHVISLDVPSDGEQYIHRCGRTGRAGKHGVMVTIGDETQMRLLASLEKKLKIIVYPKELFQGRVCAPDIE